MGSHCDYYYPNNNPQYLLTKRQSRLTQWIDSEKEVLPYPPYRDTLSPCPSLLLSADPPEHPVHLEPDPDTSSQRKRGDRATLCPAGGAEFPVCSSLPLSLLGEERSCCRCLFRRCLFLPQELRLLLLMLLPSQYSTRTAQHSTKLRITARSYSTLLHWEPRSACAGSTQALPGSSPFWRRGDCTGVGAWAGRLGILTPPVTIPW
jgi:hypothetical protein